jgi:carbonic anhydrase/acetyltransferase-like protein (isoleucine patch superfamily)
MVKIFKNFEQQSIIPYYHQKPNIASTAFIAPGAYIIGNVTIGEESGIWFNCVVRGDVESITIGANTNIQDGTIIHVTRNGWPTIIGSRVTVGHKALLHACTIDDDTFVGMGAIILDGAHMEPFSMLAAGSMLTKNKVIKSGELWAGSPAKFLRKLTEEELAFIPISANNYTKHAIEYKAQLES